MRIRRAILAAALLLTGLPFSTSAVAFAASAADTAPLVSGLGSLVKTKRPKTKA